MCRSAVFLIEKDERSRDTTDRSYIDSLKRTCICPTFKTVKKNPPYFCTDKNIPIVQLFFCCYVGFLFNFNDALNYNIIIFFLFFPRRTLFVFYPQNAVLRSRSRFKIWSGTDFFGSAPAPFFGKWKPKWFIDIHFSLYT